MAYKKRTLRQMSPTARKVARLIGELESVARRLKNLIPELQRLDLDSQALKNARAIYPEKIDYQGLGLDTTELTDLLQKLRTDVVTPKFGVTPVASQILVRRLNGIIALVQQGKD